MAEAVLTFWDIQHDNAIHLRTPNNRYIVFDLDTRNRESGATSSILKHLTSNEQFDSDPLQARELFCPVHLDGQLILHGMTDLDRSKINRYCQIYDGYNQSSSPDILLNNPDTWGGLSIQVFGPRIDSENNINNHTYVIVIELEGQKMLIPGDNGPPPWNELRLTNKFLATTENIDILFAPHHGRDCGFDMDIMRHFNPRLTIISDGGCHDLSAIGRYSAISRGWIAYDPNDSPSQRFCLTTGDDGTIRISFGRGEDDGQNFLYVRKSRQSSCSDRF